MARHAYKLVVRGVAGDGLRGRGRRESGRIVAASRGMRGVVGVGFGDGVAITVEVSVEAEVSVEVSESENSVRNFRVAGRILSVANV